MSPTPVAICVLYRSGKLLMQLRDDLPTILYPGVWGLFGGHMEGDETPETAVVREIAEEIEYELPPDFGKFAIYGDERVQRHVFHAALTVPVTALNLQEGWDLKLVSLAEIQSGRAYSDCAGQHKAIGPIHRQILLDFAQQYPQLLTS